MRQTEISGLEEYRDYNITMTAFTRIGEGVRSPFVVTRTDEHSEFLQMYLVQKKNEMRSVRDNEIICNPFVSLRYLAFFSLFLQSSPMCYCRVLFVIDSDWLE